MAVRLPPHDLLHYSTRRDTAGEGLLKYRADIDGLRALAVTAVVLCHAHFKLFSGGYLGVDIFFVISGYLITRILMAEQRLSLAAISTFYVRRIRRIIPALSAMLLACTLAALYLLSPFELVDFAKSLVASVTFTPNLYFMRTVDYFASRQETELLHLWSLGVEEQFYIAYPICLLALRQWRPRAVVPVLAVTAMLSLIFSEWLVASRPQIAFYFPGSRAWELGLGCIAALLPQRPSFPKLAYESLALSALALAVVPVLVWNNTTPWPGIHALAPCAGTAFLLWCHNQHKTWVAKFLSAPPFVGIGLISYSLYLWHWPLFMLYGRWALRPVTALEYSTLIALAVILAFLSWRWVERPFRQGKFISGKRAFVLAGVVTGIFVICSVGVVFTSGLPQRFSASARNDYSYLEYRENQAFLSAIRSETCFPWKTARYDFSQCFTLAKGRPNVVVWGDSYAMHYIPGLRDAARRSYVNLIQATSASCRPIPQLKQSDSCDAFNRAIFNHLDTSIAAVIISTRLYEQPDSLPFLKENIRDIAAKGIKVILLGPSPEYTNLVPLYAARYAQTGAPEWLRAKDKLVGEFAPLDRAMRDIAQEIPGVTYISVREIVCSGDACPLMVAGAPVEFDEGHLTLEGSHYFAARLWPRILQSLHLPAG